ncbi:NAD-dependent epimerase/dehydratase family protein [Fodinicola feengrottensis]|uniref:NAD-dependent epimerase/dehydratase family protein n=1 Tax=Fodinicola feengrottensis TaxID=435914 RepID=UPI00244361BA|nr:NAD(P)-dependent oxidoreductase [Fodinicola feengrottensis]
MILVTGGLGFIGSHTARTLADLGESCVLTQHRNATVPDLLTKELGSQIFVEPLDIADRAAWSRLGEKHSITGIVHLAAHSILDPDPLAHLDGNLRGLSNLLHAAAAWKVSRVTVASTIGVYDLASSRPLREDEPLAMDAGNVIEAYKKTAEILGPFVGGQLGIEVVNVRIGAIWGPLGRVRSGFFAVPQLIHAAAHGTALESPPSAGKTEDGIDMCYVRDCGRGIAAVQTATTLHHHTYNVGSGRLTTNGDIRDAVLRLVPDATLDLPAGRTWNGRAMNISRIQEDTGFSARI